MGCAGTLTRAPSLRRPFGLTRGGTSGRGAPVGTGQPGGRRADAQRPRVPGRGPLPRPPAELSRAGATRGLTMTRLSASERRPAARSGRRFPTGRRCPAGGKGPGALGLRQPRSALRVPHSPQLLQPQPGPAHRARPQPAAHAGPARPGRS